MIYRRCENGLIINHCAGSSDGFKELQTANIKIKNVYCSGNIFVFQYSEFNYLGYKL